MKQNIPQFLQTNDRIVPQPTAASFLTLSQSVLINHPKTKLNSVALVRTRTIPTERPPPVGEVSANFCG